MWEAVSSSCSAIGSLTAAMHAMFWVTSVWRSTSREMARTTSQLCCHSQIAMPVASYRDQGFIQ